MKKYFAIIHSLLIIGAVIAQAQVDPSIVHYSFPISFIENTGQWNPAVRFSNLLGTQPVLLLDDGIAIPGRQNADMLSGETPTEQQGSTQLRFIRPSGNMKAEGTALIAAKSNFYSGSDAAQWKEQVTITPRLCTRTSGKTSTFSMPKRTGSSRRRLSLNRVAGLRTSA